MFLPLLALVFVCWTDAEQLACMHLYVDLIGTQCLLLNHNMNALMQMGLGPLDHDGRHWVHCWPHWVPALYPHWHFWCYQVQHR